MASENKLDVYIIPENFIEGGRILNGMFKTRNFIEAITLSLIVGVPLWMIQYPSVAAKITVFSIFVLPVFMIAVAGINDSSLIEFVQQFLRWRKTKRVMLYNGQVRSRAVRPADVIDAQEMPKDKLVQAIDDWKKKRKSQNQQTSLVEGVDFVFFDDENTDSSFLSAEKKILDGSQYKDSKAVKKQKKKKKKDAEPLLLENNSNSEKKENIQKLDSSHDEQVADMETCEVIEIIDEIEGQQYTANDIASKSSQLSQDEFQIREGTF